MLASVIPQMHRYTPAARAGRYGRWRLCQRSPARRPTREGHEGGVRYNCQRSHARRPTRGEGYGCGVGGARRVVSVLTKSGAPAAGRHRPGVALYAVSTASVIWHLLPTWLCTCRTAQGSPGGHDTPSGEVSSSHARIRVEPIIASPNLIHTQAPSLALTTSVRQGRPPPAGGAHAQGGPNSTLIHTRHDANTLPHHQRA